MDTAQRQLIPAYKVTRISDGYVVTSIWPATYLNSPDEYTVQASDGTPITSIEQLMAR